jgi:hypothetical protein
VVLDAGRRLLAQPRPAHGPKPTLPIRLGRAPLA